MLYLTGAGSLIALFILIVFIKEEPMYFKVADFAEESYLFRGPLLQEC